MCLQIFLLALLNLVTFSIYEVEEDRQEGFYSIATELGKKNSMVVAYLIMAVLIICLLVFQTSSNFSWFIISGTLVYASMYVMPAFFTRYDRYRIVGDAVFLLAALFLLF